MNVGVKKLKAKGKKGVTKELTQVQDMNVFCPVDVESLTYDEKRKPYCRSCFSRRRGTFQ